MTDKSEAEKQMALLKLAEAQQSGKSVVYTAQDGCEITITPLGHVFYNVSDWW